MVSQPVASGFFDFGNDFTRRQEAVLEFIRAVMTKYNSKLNCKLIIGLEDKYEQEHGICVFSKYNINERNTMIPDVYAMENYHGSMKKDALELDQKRRAAVFAGTTTGRLRPESNDRLAFSNRALEFDDIDSWITSIVQIPEVHIANSYPRYKEFMRDNVSENEQKKYRYLISIDGNATAWNRVPWILNSNSILLKKNSEKVNWYYPFLIENHHYIPFDTIDDIDLGITEDRCEYIIGNAHEFVRDYLTLDKHQLYMYQIIQEIAVINDTKSSPTFPCGRRPSPNI